MQRKVIQQGPSSLMISLPFRWVRENNITKGDYLHAAIVDGSLIVNPNDAAPESSTTIHLTNNDYFDRSLMVKYRRGYNEVIVRYDNSSIVEKIRETLQFLIGFEIVDMDSQRCIIKNVSESTDSDYTVVMRRLFQIVRTMSSECQSFMKTGDNNHLTTAVDMRTTLTKFEQLALRLINKRNDISAYKKSELFFQVWNIASFGKMWSSLAKKQLPKKPKLPKKELEFFERTVQFTGLFCDIFYKQNKNKMGELKDELYNYIRPEGERYIESSPHPMIIFYLMRICDRMYEFSLSWDPYDKSANK